eukprot:4824217-Pyramimonas_sp.AAC.1
MTLAGTTARYGSVTTEPGIGDHVATKQYPQLKRHCTVLHHGARNRCSSGACASICINTDPACALDMFMTMANMCYSPEENRCARRERFYTHRAVLQCYSWHPTREQLVHSSLHFCY